MRSLYWVTGVNPEPWSAGTPYRKGPHAVGLAKDGKLKAYQEALGEEFAHQNPHAVVHGGHLSVTFYFWRSSAHGNQADATNMQKATEDALQKHLYENDRYNHHVQSFIMEQTPTTSPHILIEIDEFVRPEVEVPEGLEIPKWAGSDWVEPEEELF